MSNEPAFSEQFEQAIDDFRDFLDDVKPPIFITGSLTLILRTEPPARFGSARVAGVVADWAEEKSSRTGERVSDYMISAMRRIIDAYGMNAIQDFKPKDFYRPFVVGLLERCPEDERDAMQMVLRKMQSHDPEVLQIRSTADFQTGNVIPVRGQRLPREAALADFLGRLHADVSMPQDEFDEAIEGLKLILLGQPALPAPSVVARLTEIGIAHFNAAAVLRSSKIFEVVAGSVERYEDPIQRRRMRESVKSNRLDESVLTVWAGDPKRHRELAAVIQQFADVSPGALLSILATEKNAARVRHYSNLLEVHGPRGFAAVVAKLTSGDAVSLGADYLSSLLGVLARVTAPVQGDERQRAIGAVGRYVASDKQQLREPALQALKNMGGKDTVPQALRALDPAAYATLSSENAEDLRRHLKQAMELLFASELDSAVAVVAEVAVGARGAEFKLGRALRDAAMEVLSARQGPLPRRAALVVVSALKTFSASKFKIFTGALKRGGDSQTAARWLDLVADSPEPEVAEALAHPSIRKLSGR